MVPVAVAAAMDTIMVIAMAGAADVDRPVHSRDLLSRQINMLEVHHEW